MVWKSGWNRGINSSKFTLEVWLQASKADKPSNCFPALRDSTRCCQLKACGKRNEPIQSSAVGTSSSWNANATWLQKWNFKMKFQYDSPPPQIPFLRKRVGIALRSSSPPQNVWTFCNWHPNWIPLWIKWECWCQQFYSDNSGDADPLSENASIESETPRYFQVVYEHHFL